MNRLGNIFPRFLSGLVELDDVLVNNAYVGSTLKPFPKSIVDIGTLDDPFAQGYFTDVYNSNGQILVNRITSNAPLSSTLTDGHLDLWLNIDPLTLQVVNGALGVKHLTQIIGASEQITFDTPLYIVPGDPSQVKIAVDGTSIVVNQDGQLAANLSGDSSVNDFIESKYKFSQPLSRNALTNYVALEHDETLEVTADGLLSVSETAFATESIADAVSNVLTFHAPLYNQQRNVSLATDDALDVKDAEVVDQAGDVIGTEKVLTVKTQNPLFVDTNGLGLKYKKGLKLDKDNYLETNIDESLKGKGAIKIYNDYVSMLTDFSVGDLISMGIGSDADVETSVIALAYDPEFTAKGGKLGLESPGYCRIPFFQLERGLNSSSAFIFNDSAERIEVPNVQLQRKLDYQTDDSYATCAAYVNQLYQAKDGGGVDIGALQNGRREVSTRVDGITLKVENQNLKCQYKGATNSPITVDNSQATIDVGVDGTTIKVEGSKLIGGYIGEYGISIQECAIRGAYAGKDGVMVDNEAGQILGAYTGSNGISVKEGAIECTIQGGTGIVREGENLNVNLTSSNGGILVEGANVMLDLISGTPEFIQITENVINFLPYVPGEGIIITGNVISAVPALQTQRDDEETDETDDATYKDTRSGRTVHSTAPTPLQPIPVIPPPVIPPTPIPTPFGGGGVTGGLPPKSTRRKKPAVTEIDNTVWSDIIGYIPTPLGYDDDNDIIYDSPPPQNIVTTIDAGGCLRFLYDTPICYQGIKNESSTLIVNLDILRDYNDDINIPQTIGLISQLVQPLSNSLADYLKIADAQNTYQPLLSLQSPLELVAGGGLRIDTTQIDFLTLMNRPDMSQYMPVFGIGEGLEMDATNNILNVIANPPDLSSYITYDVAATLYQPIHGVLTALSQPTPLLTSCECDNISPRLNSTFNLGTQGQQFLNIYCQSIQAANLGSLAYKSSITSDDISGQLVDLSSYLTVANASATYQQKFSVGSGLSLTQNVLSLNQVDYASLSNRPDLSVYLTSSNASATYQPKFSVGSGLSLTQNVLSLNQVDYTSLSNRPDLSVYLTTSNASATYQPKFSVGSGLSLTANALSVNAAQTQITSLGILTGLTSSGIVSITSTNETIGAGTGALQVSGGIYAALSIKSSRGLFSNRGSPSYNGSLASWTEGTSLCCVPFTMTDTVAAANTSFQMYANIYSSYPTISAVNSGITVQNAYGLYLYGAPQAGTNVTFVNSYALYVATGKSVLQTLDTNGVTRILNTTDSISTTTGALQVSGGLGLGGSLSTGGNASIGGTLNVGNAFTQASTTVNDAQTPASGTRGFYSYTQFNAPTLTSTNTGVTTTTAATVYIYNAPVAGTNTTIANRYGLLAGARVAIADNTASSSSTSGALVVTGGTGIQGSLFVGANLSVTGTTSLTGTVTIPAPTAANHAATKSYIDGLTYLTAGTGLSKTGSTLSLSSIDYNGSAIINKPDLSVYLTTATASSTYLTTATAATTYQPIIAASTGLTKTGNILSVNAAQPQITSVGTLASLSVTGVTSLGTNDIGDNYLEIGARRVDSNFCYIDFHSSPNTDFDARIFKASGGTGDLTVQNLGSLNWTAGSTTVTMLANNGSIYPSIDQQGTLGTSAKRWMEVFSALGVGTTSDINQKEDVRDLQETTMLVRKLKPITYRLKGHAGEHFGLSAQQTRSAFNEVGMESKGLIIDDEQGSPLSMRYHELSAIIIKAMQSILDRLDSLERNSIQKAPT